MKLPLEKYEPLVKQAINQNQENTVSSQYKPLVSDSIEVSKDTGIVPIQAPDLPVTPTSKITTAVTPSMYQMNALPEQTQPVKTNNFDLSGNNYVQKQPVQPAKTGSFDGSGANYVAPTQPLNKQTVVPDYSGLTRDVPKENVNPYSADESMYILEKMGNGFATLPNMIPRIIGFAGENIATFNPLNDVNKVTLDMFGDKLTSEEKKVLQDKVNKTEQKDAKTEEYWNKVLNYQIVQDRNAKIDEKYKGKDISKDAQFAADVSVGAINMLPQTVLAYFSGGGSYALMFADSAAQGKIEALNDGATDDQATTYGYLKGAIEIGTEMLSGGIPGVPDGKGIASTGLLDPLVKNPMKKIAKTELGKEVVETVVEYLGEGAEEYLSEVLGNYAKAAYDQNKVKSFKDIQDQAIYAFWTGAFTSVLMEAGRIGAVKIANDVVNSNVKAVEDLSKSEQLQYTRNLLAKSNTNLVISDTYQGKEITNSSGLYDPKNNVIVIPTETYNNGNILTTSIMHEFTHAMEVSGNYQKVRDSILDFLDKNGRLEPLRKDIENRYPSNTDIDGEVVADFIQDNFFKRVIKKNGEYQTYTNFADLNAFIMDLDTKEKGLFKKVLGSFLKSHTQGELTAKYDSLIKEYEKAQKNNDIKRIKELQPAIDRVFTQLDLTNNAQYFKSLELSFNSAIEYANTHEDLQFIKEEPKKELMAIHNLTEEKLLKTLDLGGFPAPSIAVTKDKIGHTNFGEISVIFDPNVLEGTNTYWRDAYTSRFPDTTFGFNNNSDLDTFKNHMDNLADKLTNWNNGEFIPAGKENIISNKLNYYIYQHRNSYVGDLESDLSSLASSYLGKVLYLEQVKNIDIDSFNSLSELKTTLNNISNDQSLQAMKSFMRTLGANDYLIKDTDRFTSSGNRKSFKQMTSEFTIEDVLLRMIQGSDINRESNYDFDFGFNNIAPYLRKVMRSKESIKENSSILRKINEEDFNNLVNDIELSIDLISKQLASENNLSEESIKDKLKVYAKKQGEFSSITGDTGLEIYFRKRFDIDLNKNLDFNYDKRNGKTHQFDQLILPKILLDKGGLFEIVDYKLNDNGTITVNYFENEDNYNNEEVSSYTFDPKNEIKKYNYAKLLNYEFNRMYNIATSLFEAKPNRVVNFNEISKVVIPNDSSEMLKNKLNELNIPFEEYDANKVGDRFRVVNQQEQAKFKLKPETNLNEVNKEVKDEVKTAVSKTYSTVASSGVIKNEALGKMQELLDKGEIVHEVKTDKKSLDKAITSIDGKYKQSYDQIKALFESGKAIGKDDVVVAEVLLEKFGRKDATKADQMRALELTMMLTASGTNAGQYIQSLNMIKKMGGVGQLMYYDRLAQRYNKQYSKYNKDFTVSDELKLEMLNAKGEEEIKTVSEKIANEMIDKMPSTALDKVTTWQMMAMLSNPATDVRNVMSNVFMASMAELKDINAGLLEMNLPKEQRTKALVLDKGAWKFAKEIYEQNKDIVLNSGTFDMTKNLEHQKRIFKTEVLEKYKNVRFNLLEWEDSLFKSWAFKRVFAQEMTAKGLTKDTITPVQLNELIQKASKEATVRTFQEASAIANGLNRFAKQNAVAGVAIQSILPFKKTPINIAKQGFEYSPAGLIKDVLVAKNNLETGKWDKTQFFDKLGSGLAGTEMAALGFLLYSLGVISIGKDDDESKRMADYNRSLGVTDFSLHIGDKYYTIDWITPTIIPFMMGAELNRLTSKGNKKLDEVALQALADTFNPMFELTLLRGLSSAISSYETDGVGKVGNILSTMASNYATQFVPSALGSVAKTLDETKRTTYTGQGILADTIAKIKAKIPVLAEQNAPVIDVKGQEVKQIGDWWLRGLQNFLSPTKITQDITDKTDIEIKRLYDSTGESSIIPQMPPSKLTYNSGNYDLSADEKTTYAETYGQTSYNLLTDLFNNELYKGLSDEEKGKVVSDAYNYAKSLAKGEVITGRNLSYTDTTYNKIKEAERNGIEVTEYLIMKNRFDNIKSSEDFSKKEQIIAELVYSGKSDDEIYQYLVYIGGYEYSSSDQKYIDILRSVK